MDIFAAWCQRENRSFSSQQVLCHNMQYIHDSKVQSWSLTLISSLLAIQDHKSSWSPAACCHFSRWQKITHENKACGSILRQMVFFFQYYISVHNRLWLKKKTDKAVYLGFKQKTEVDTRLQFLKDNVSPQNYCNILLCGFQKKSGHMMDQWIRVPNQLCVTFPPKYETDVTAWHGDIN